MVRSLPLRQRAKVTLVATLIISLAGLSAEAQQTEFIPDSLFPLEDIPESQFRDELLQLPPSAQGIALRRLNSFSFPPVDFLHMRVGRTGGILYVDPAAPVDFSPSTAMISEPSGITAAETFSLHSKPNAPNVLFIDVDGHTISGTAWNQTSGVSVYEARPFNTDGNESTFSATELDQVAEIWYRIAEDFAMFDVDVTTEDPGVFGPRTGRILITPNIDANGVPMPYSSAGGVAYVNVFGSSNYEFYSPALVYSNNLSNQAPYIAEAASHEAGHNLALGHDGTSTSAYYSGHGSGATSWGPIMGTGYNDNVSQWSKGEYADANNQQDDIQIMSSRLGLRNDDHADSQGAATPLQIETDGTVSATTPQTDPFNMSTSNKGIINDRNDVDLFTMDLAAGPVDLTVTPSWAAWLRNSGGRGTNLDIQAELLDVFGNSLGVAEPVDETNAVISATVPAGIYYLSITGVGNTSSPYTDYGSQGQYYITGQVVPADSEPPTPDTQPPAPDPMIFSSLPEAISDSQITMTATQASDDSGDPVQYYFASAETGDSGWINSRTYTASGLAPSATYSFQVKARDAAGNETALSSPAQATTDDTPVNPEPPLPVNLTVTDSTAGEALLSWDDVDNETSYEVFRETWQSKRSRWRSLTLLGTLSENATSFTDASGAGRFRYLVRSINAIGSTDSSWVIVDVTTTIADCKGGPKKCGS